MTFSQRFSPQVERKGTAYWRKDPSRVVLDPDRPGWGRVKGSDGQTWYRVTSDYAVDPFGIGDFTWASCSCPHGSNKGDSRCYHVVALFRAILQEWMENNRDDLHGQVTERRPEPPSWKSGYGGGLGRQV